MFDQFEAGFREAIRVEIDWSRLQALNPRVSLEIVEPAVLSISLPWHRKDPQLSNLGDWVNLKEIPLAVRQLHPDTRSAVLSYALEMSRNPESQLLNVPAWRLPGGGRLAIDGCHRLAAMRISGSPGKVCLWTLEAPFDPELMPLLARFGAPQSRRFKRERFLRRRLPRLYNWLSRRQRRPE